MAGEEPGKGVVLVQAPEVFSEGYIILSADCDGYSAVKMISFRERTMSPDAEPVTVRMDSGSDTVSVAFSANFEYILTCDAEWLQASQDTVSRQALVFVAEPNTADTVRTCTVTVSPKDNPGFACKTFTVMQATDGLPPIDYVLDEESDEGFSFEITDPVNRDRMTLYAPVDGGEAAIWTNWSRNISKGDTTDPEWFKSDLTKDGFYKLTVKVDPNESAEPRDSEITLKIGNIGVRVKVSQAGKPSSTSGE